MSEASLCELGFDERHPASLAFRIWNPAPNGEHIAVWNDILVPKFTRFRHVIVDGFASHSAAALERHGPSRGNRVLDVGCGFGETSIELGEMVGTGSVLGVDCAPGFVAVGRADATRSGVTNVRFEVADAQTAPFESEFDLCFSRFGTMFSQSPVLAMKNLRKALKPRGRLLMVVWRRIEDNDWVHIPKRIALRHLPVPPDTAPKCGPGPFSMADRDAATEILEAAGFTDIAFDRNDCPVMVGRNLAEAMAFQLAIGPAGEIVREAAEEGEEKRPALEADLRATLAMYETDCGIIMSSSSWSVTARPR